MSDSAANTSDRAAKVTWIKTILGVDLPATPGGSAGSTGDEGQPLQSTGFMDGVSSFAGDVVSGIKSVGETIKSGVETVVEGVKAGLQEISDKVVAAEVSKFEDSLKSLDAEIKNVKDAGLDASHYEAQAKSLRDAQASAMKLDGNLAKITELAKLMIQANSAANDAHTDVARVSKSAVEGVTGAITHMRDGAKKSIDKLAKTSKEKPELQKRLDGLDKLIDETGKLTDRAQRAKKLKQLNVDAESLFTDAAAAAKDDDIVQEVFAKALKERYGVEIKNPTGMKNTHLDKMYKMFDKVPETDIVQGKLKTIKYDPVDSKGKKNTGAAYGGAQIFMGDYGEEDWTYQDPVTKQPVKQNGFSISTLHELGHSVDDRFKIMDGNKSKAGAGGWKPESIQSVAVAYIGEFKAGPGKTLKIDDKDLAKMVEKALNGAKTKKPTNMSDDDWKKQDKQGQPSGMSNEDWALIETLLDACNKRRHDAWPWGEKGKHDIGGRCYHEAYAGQWWSYDMGTLGKSLTVRDYQWRAPGEYFAELYAFSYFNSKPPPSGVEAALAAYMFGGKAADDSAPH